MIGITITEIGIWVIVASAIGAVVHLGCRLVGKMRRRL